MDEATDKALRQCADQLKDRDTDKFPDRFTDEYRQLSTDLKRARENFNKSFNNGDRNNAPKDFDTWRDSLRLLQQGNARFAALINLEIVANVASIAASLAETAEFGGSKELAQLTQYMKKLQDELKDADRKIQDKALKMSLKLFATAVAELIVDVGLLPEAATAVGAIGVAALIEYVFGGGDILKTGLSYWKKLVESFEKLDEDWKAMIEAFEEHNKTLTPVLNPKNWSKGLGYGNDGVDIYYFIQHHKNIKERIRVAAQTQKTLMQNAMSCAKDLAKIKPALEEHYKDVKKALAIVRDETAKYTALKAQIAQAQAAAQ
jgi:hypothetical protein